MEQGGDAGHATLAACGPLPTMAPAMARNGHRATLGGLKSLPRPLYGHVDALPNHVVRHRHRHPWNQLAYAVQGVLQVHTDRARFVAPPQRAVWIPAGVMHRVLRTDGATIRSLYIGPQVPDWPDDRCRAIAVAPLLRELIRAFAERPVEYAPDSADGRLAQVLLDELAAAADARMALPLPVDSGLRRQCARIAARPEAACSIEDVAARLGAATRTVSRRFLRETGMTFRRWRQQARLLDALPALERGDAVTAVALDSGYQSVSAFIAAFRRQFDVPPGQFRRTPHG